MLSMGSEQNVPLVDFHLLPIAVVFKEVRLFDLETLENFAAVADEETFKGLFSTETLQLTTREVAPPSDSSHKRRIVPGVKHHEPVIDRLLCRGFKERGAPTTLESVPHLESGAQRLEDALHDTRAVPACDEVG